MLKGSILSSMRFTTIAFTLISKFVKFSNCCPNIVIHKKMQYHWDYEKLNEIIYLKHLAQSTAHKKPSVNFR